MKDRLDSQVPGHRVQTIMKEEVEAHLVSQVKNELTRAEKTQWA